MAVAWYRVTKADETNAHEVIYPLSLLKWLVRVIAERREVPVYDRSQTRVIGKVVESEIEPDGWLLVKVLYFAEEKPKIRDFVIAGVGSLSDDQEQAITSFNLHHFVAVI